MAVPIVDSHVHLWPETHLPTIAWHGPGNPLGSQYSIDEYRAASKGVRSSPPSCVLRGFVYVEVDRISSEDEGSHGWRHVLDEVAYVTRIILGEPVPGQGHGDVDRALCLGMIPWAPVPAGSETVQRYMSLVRERTRTDAVWKKVRGVRYLVQDKPAGTMLTPAFIDALKWLGRQKLVFDLGVDARQGGLGQLREALEMMRRAYQGVDQDERIRFIISELFSFFSFLFFFSLS
jgi:L-rhamnono-1,4-lactonase